MLAAVGCLIPEILSLNGVELGEPVWWKVGAAKLQGGLTLNYAGIEGFRIAGGYMMFDDSWLRRAGALPIPGVFGIAGARLLCCLLYCCMC
jgi:hypothetical protein